MHRFVLIGLAASLALTGMACEEADGLRGSIKIDGSSTVYLISQKGATNFRKLHPAVDISVGISGTGGGMRKFAAGELDIADASRRMRPTEKARCRANGIEPIELQVAWDGLAVIINKENTWADKLTVEQLKEIWHPKTMPERWSDVNPAWPDKEIVLFGPGADSGTFEYFTTEICGKKGVTRTDYSHSEDDNGIIQGVMNNKYALGYLGLAYLEAYRSKLNAVAIQAKGAKEFVPPTVASVLSGKYKPLSRPLFIYVRQSSLKEPAVQEFVEYMLRRNELVSEVGYVRLTVLQQHEMLKRFREAVEEAEESRRMQAKL